MMEKAQTMNYVIVGMYSYDFEVYKWSNKIL